ncbi:MAG: helix-turn-helix transcriptional regulator [Clostridia bacterium]|nr:helix-turn-helix transcriptional regulator [Clostridia bacterium]
MYGINVHTHLYFEIEYVLSGNCFQNFQNTSYEFARGDIALFKPDSRHKYQTSGELEVLRLKINPEFLPQIYKLHEHEFSTANIIHLPPNEVKSVENILLTIEKEFNDKNKFYSEAISGYLEVLFTLLIRFHTTSKNGEVKASNVDFKSIIAYIEKNLKTVTPSAVASYSGYNFPYFSKLFKKHTGRNLSEYINLLKLDVASKMLSESNKRIEAIGYEVGFNNKSYFYRVFKRYYGVTPEEYRRSSRKRN